MNSHVEVPALAIIGAGKVGSALAAAFTAHGYRVTAIYSRTREHAEALARQVGAKTTSTPLEAAMAADLTILAVPDGAISAVAATLAPGDLTGRAIVHTSGAFGLNLLESLMASGVMTGCLHPAFPFSNMNTDQRSLWGITFALESDHPRLSKWLYDLVDVMKGHALWLRQDQKALYHAALALTSNYTVVLYAASKAILLRIGAAPDAADNALLALLRGTVENLARQGAPSALTGPLVRGDFETVAAHVEALDPLPDIRQAYVALVRLAMPLLAERGVDTEAVGRLLNNWEGI